VSDLKRRQPGIIFICPAGRRSGFLFGSLERAYGLFRCIEQGINTIQRYYVHRYFVKFTDFGSKFIRRYYGGLF
jgi:hypothetical protein